jgi:hypothetical protein
MRTGNSTKRPSWRAEKGRKRAVLLTAAVVTAAAAAGLARPASASPAMGRPPGLPPAGAGGTEHFQTMNTTTSATSTTNPLIAWGVFTAAGTDHEHAGNTDTFVFPGGSVTVRHAPAKGATHQSFNPKSCLFVFSEKGTFQLSGGTGTYRGISGSGTYALSGVGIGAKLKSGACNPSQTAPAVAQQQEIAAVGQIWLPRYP